MSTKVKVIEPNVYAGPGWRALPKSAAGDIIEVATARYAADLVNSGLVAYVVETPAEEAPKTKPAKGGDSDPKANGDGGDGSEDGQETGDSEPNDNGDSTSDDSDSSDTADGGDGSEDEAPKLDNLFDKWLVDKLVEAGLDTPDKVAAADDKTLQGINGIGKKTLAEIREKTP